MLFKRIRIRSYETGLYFRDGEFRGLLDRRRYWFADPMGRIRVDVLSRRYAWIIHEDLDEIVRSNALAGRADVLDLKDHQRALVWIDGRFDCVLEPGLYALWNDLHEVRIDIVDASTVRFDHPAVGVIARWSGVSGMFNVVTVDPGFAGVYFRDGAYVETLAAGQYLFWRNEAKVKVFHVDLRERLLDVAGQEIMTADKVTLRLNAWCATVSPMPLNLFQWWMTAPRPCTAKPSWRCGPLSAAMNWMRCSRKRKRWRPPWNRPSGGGRRRSAWIS
jgi:hypothetical protein